MGSLRTHPSEVTFGVQARSRGGRLDLGSRRVGQSFAGPGEIKRREVVLGPQHRPGEIKSREVELGLRVGLLLLVVSQRRSYGHCLCDSVPHSSWDSNCVVH